ncbi:metal-sensing transcriptional repressor [Clostridiaceae bacterium M8S5]|nr:metal-sensing transcriptional repressor [Clostridiaceae bacterium M8S5]
MDTCKNCRKINNRINKIIGQLNAVNKMVGSEDVSCEEILIQLNAVKSAVHKVGQVILENHLKHCVNLGLKNGDGDEILVTFSKAIEQFSRMT